MMYQDFVRKFLNAIYSVAPIRAIRLKFHTKPWLRIDILNAIRNCDKYHKKFKLSDKEIDKDNFKNKQTIFT